MITRAALPPSGVRLLTAFAFAIVASLAFSQPSVADDVPPFTGAKSSWHEGFDRYDYLMDENTLAITPYTAPEGEKLGVKDPEPGKRRCIIVAPKKAASGNPWSWQGCYWNHEPQTEVELLKRGFHIAYISANATLKPGKEWEAWYAFLTEKHGLSKRPAFIGMSRGGEYSYTWAINHPDKVACIYADNPGGNRDILMKLGDLAANDVPLLHVCGSIDPLLGKYALPIEAIYQQWGGRITTMIKEGKGHHPHSLRDPKPLADWIEQNYQPAENKAPAFVSPKFSRTYYYNTDSIYRDSPSEKVFITCRGPGFVKCYSRYQFPIEGVEGSITIVAPERAAPNQPWVLRSDYLERDATVDQALLDQGFHIVTGPVPYNADGPILSHWNTVYQYLVDRGFSRRPVLEGRGGAAGDAYAWAIANPEKVACLYAENPVLRSKMTPTPILENLTALANTGVPILHVSGTLDPYLESQTRAAEKQYQSLGGNFTLLLQEGQSHFPLSPQNPKPAADFITASIR